MLALVRPLTCMDSYVLDEVSLLFEAFVATSVSTDKWSFTFMDPKM